MLPRKYRLNSRTRLVNASSIAAPFFLLKVASNGLSYNRYGFVVSRNIDKRAVVRNKIKRKMRNCIESMSNIQGGPASLQGGHDMLFIMRKNIADQSLDDICTVVLKILKSRHFLL